AAVEPGGQRDGRGGGGDAAGWVVGGHRLLGDGPGELDAFDARVPAAGDGGGVPAVGGCGEAGYGIAAESAGGAGVLVQGRPALHELVVERDRDAAVDRGRDAAGGGGPDAGVEAAGDRSAAS